MSLVAMLRSRWHPNLFADAFGRSSTDPCTKGSRWWCGGLRRRAGVSSVETSTGLAATLDQGSRQAGRRM